MTTILGYWDIRGLGHAIRLLLEYTGTEFVDKQYVYGSGPELSDWPKEKETLGLDFPNLPYLIDGHVRLTQSNAILRYIARKHNMCGESESEIIRVDLMQNQAVDFRMELLTIIYLQGDNFDSLKGPYLEKLPGKLKLFSQFLGERKWFVGDKITYPDFIMYDALDQNRILEPKCLDPFPNLKNFLKRFETLEKIAAYMKSSSYMKTPIDQKMSKWSTGK